MQLLVRGPHFAIGSECHLAMKSSGVANVSNPNATSKAGAAMASNCCGAEKVKKSGHPESNQGPSDCCSTLQSDALPTEL